MFPILVCTFHVPPVLAVPATLLCSRLPIVYLKFYIKYNVLTKQADKRTTLAYSEKRELFYLNTSHNCAWGQESSTVYFPSLFEMIDFALSVELLFWGSGGALHDRFSLEDCREEGMLDITRKEGIWGSCWGSKCLTLNRCWSPSIRHK